MRLMFAATDLFRNSPGLIDLPADTWVFGDVHGNYRDLSFFVHQVFGLMAPALSGQRILTLGDYVDRGPHSLECVVLLFALKLVAPNSVHLLRGNHEDPLVNGDVATYRSDSFREQCTAILGPVGPSVWCATNLAFQHLPVAAIIDERVYCAHGGIPRYSGGDDRRLERLRDPNFPRFWSLFSGVDVSDDRWSTVFDALWMDPADDDADATDAFGFGPSPRGGPTKIFSSSAVDAFLDQYGLDLLVRAHQEKSDGLRIAKGARCITVFSSSNYQAKTNSAGAIFIAANATVRLYALQATAGVLTEVSAWHPCVV